MANVNYASETMHNIRAVLEARNLMVNQLIDCRDSAVIKALEELERCFGNLISEYAKLLTDKES